MQQSGALLHLRSLQSSLSERQRFYRVKRSIPQKGAIVWEIPLY